MLWIQIIVTVLLSLIIFLVLSKTELGMVINATLFAVILFSILVVIKYLPIKEPFFFEVSPYKKCEKGFYGRPLSFEYNLPECEEQCNKY